MSNKKEALTLDLDVRVLEEIDLRLKLKHLVHITSLPVQN